MPIEDDADSESEDLAIAEPPSSPVGPVSSTSSLCESRDASPSKLENDLSQGLASPLHVPMPIPQRSGRLRRLLVKLMDYELQ